MIEEREWRDKLGSLEWSENVEQQSSMDMVGGWVAILSRWSWVRGEREERREEVEIGRAHV